jgi:drug/metabolite transporter (DMT)-like permease
LAANIVQPGRQSNRALPTIRLPQGATAARFASMNWLVFALLTVLSWGVYGVLLHKGRGHMPMGPESPHAGLKAFLFVCIAYALIGVAAAALLKMRGSNWSFTPDGIKWSLIAGVTGAIGAFTLVLALGAAAPIYKGAAAAAVMPIVFAGAPIVNTILAMTLHPPEGGLKSLPLPFVLGCLMAAVGAFLVAKFAPTNTGGAKPAAPKVEAVNATTH